MVSSPSNHQEKMDKYRIDHKSAFMTIMLSIFIDVLGYSMILPLLPIIAGDTFGAPDFLIGILIASNAFAALCMAPVWGKLSDQYGRKPFLLVSQAGTLAAFLIFGFSNSLEGIFFSRILDGIFGGQIPIIRAYITDVTDAKTRSIEIGKITGVMAFGMIFGPAIGGLVGVINWRYPAFIAACLSGFTIFLTIRKVVESMPKERILELRQRKIDKKEAGHVTRALLLRKDILLRLIEMYLIVLAFVIFNSSFPLVMNLRYGLDVAMIGLFASVAGILMVITGGGLVKRLIKKHGEKKMFIIAIFAMILSFLLYPFMYEPWMLLIFVFPYAFGNVFIRTIIMTNISRSVEEDQQGLVSGYGTNMQSIAQISAPLIAYAYLDLSVVFLLGIALDAYFLIGITGALILVSLLLITLYDMKKYPEVFMEKEQ